MTNALRIESNFRRAPKLIPSGPKAKDFLFKAPRIMRLAPALNVLQHTVLRDQGSLGSCVGFSTSFAAESIRNKFRPMDGDSNVSCELAYTLAKLESGLLGQGDTGASIRGGLDAYRKWGNCAERFVPYDMIDWDVMPGQAVLDLAAPHKVTLYERLTVNPDNYRETIDAAKTAMNLGLRVVAGIRVPRGMFGISGPIADHARQWSWTDPALNTIVGNHAVFLAGYDDAIFPSGLGSVLMANSWGPGWGENGVSAVPWISFTDLAFELWAIHDFDGFRDGAPAPEVITPERDSQLRAELAALGLALVPEDYAPVYELLRRRGLTDQQIALFAGVSESDLAAFKQSAITSLAAWSAF